jgi:hypothetical protein
MIKHLKVKNVHGNSYEMHLLTNKQENTVSVNGNTYFNSYYVTCNGDVSYKMFILPILIIKTESENLLMDSAAFLNENEEAVIELDFDYRTDNGNYHSLNYKLVYTHDGIIDELLNGKTIRCNDTTDFNRDLDTRIFRLLNNQLIVLDFSLHGNVDKCLRIGEQLISTEGFNKFMVFFFRSLGYEILSIEIDSTSGSDEVILVYKEDNFKIPLRAEEPNVQHLFIIGTFMLSAFSTGSTLFLSTLDDYIPSNELKIIFNLFAKNQDVSGEPRVPCQIVASLQNIDIVGRESINNFSRHLPDSESFKIYREQLMILQEHKNLLYYHWQKSIF